MRKTITVTEVSHPRYTHRCRYPGPNGKLRTSWFKNETDALAFAKKKGEELGQEGKAFGTIDRDERAVLEFWRAFVDRNEDTPPPPLMDVLREYADRWAATRSSVTVEKAVETYIATKEAEGLRDRSLQTIESRCGRFAKDFAGRPLASITPVEISDWILRLRASRIRGRGKVTRSGEMPPLGLEAKRNHRIAIHGLYTFAKARGWVKENPVADAARPRPKRKQPGILRPVDVARFLAAVDAVDPGLVPFWAVRFFAGVREQEALRMDWSMVDLEAGEINLPGTITKTSQPRTLKVEAALEAFLEPHSKASGDLCPFTPMERRYRLLKARKMLKEEDAKAKKGTTAFPSPMPANCARHSFATYHLLKFRHAGETALQLGHGGSPEMLHRHYKGIARDADAEGFWEIRPAKRPDNVVRIKRGKKAPAKKTTTRRKAR